MRFTARARLETWAHASRAQSEDETYGMLECVADRAGDSARRGKRTCADGAGSADVVAVEHAARSGRMEMSAWECENRWYVRLMKLAHELAMEGRGEEAQDLRVAATHARNYRWMRDHSSPESCLYYLCSDRTQARFNDPELGGQAHCHRHCEQRGEGARQERLTLPSRRSASARC